MSMLNRGNNITRKKIALLCIAFLVISGLLATGGILVHNKNTMNASYNSQKQNTTKKQTVDSTKPTAKLKVPAATANKTACDLFDAKIAASIIGAGAIKNDKLPASGNLEFISTSCEYTTSNKKAAITLYKYPSPEKAIAGKSNAETQQLVLEDGGKKTSIQPKTSVAEVKGKFVVTVTVTNSDKFDTASSQQLLKYIAGKLN